MKNKDGVILFLQGEMTFVFKGQFIKKVFYRDKRQRNDVIASVKKMIPPHKLKYLEIIISPHIENVKSKTHNKEV